MSLTPMSVMISRALGPEFGGAIGFLFFVANVLATGLYVSGFTEAVLDNFGKGGTVIPDELILRHVIKQGHICSSYYHISPIIIHEKNYFSRGPHNSHMTDFLRLIITLILNKRERKTL